MFSPYSAGPPIDIRDWKYTGERLQREIEKAVYETQRFIMKPLPDKLLMTKDQFNYLDHQTSMYKEEDADLRNTKNRFYKTKYNLMEVEVTQ